MSEPSAQSGVDTSASDDLGAPAQPEEVIETRLWRALGDDVARAEEVEPPPRFPHARERILMCRLYVGLVRSLGEDFGAPFAAHADSASVRAIGIYVTFRTMMCLPVHAGAIAQALRLPRATVLHALQLLMKHGYVERVGNAYRVTEKVNLPDLGERMQARIEMILDTARKLAAFRTSPRDGGQGVSESGEP